MLTYGSADQVATMYEYLHYSLSFYYFMVWFIHVISCSKSIHQI